MGQAPRYRTLRDYLTVIRTQRAAIIACLLLFGGAALAYSLSQEPEYEAEVALQFRSIEEEETRLLDTNSLPRTAPTQLASANADFTKSGAVVAEAARRLGGNVTRKALEAAIDVQAEAQTAFVVVKASAGSPETALRIAQAFAEAAREVKTRLERRRLRDAANALKRSGNARVNEAADRFSETVFRERIARLNALADVVDPVVVARAAEKPTSPASPKTVRTTLLGLLVGLTFGLVAAFVRDTLDVRLRSRGDVRRELDYPVLGMLREDALGAAAVGTGTKTARLEPEDVDAFQVIRTNLDFLSPQQRIRSVAVTSAVAEEGKSTVSLGLATALQAAGRNVLLVECDLRRPVLAARLGTLAAPGLVELLNGAATPQDVVRNLVAPANGHGESGTGRLDVITAGEGALTVSGGLGSPAFRDFLGVVSRSYDTVVLDCTPLLPIADALQLIPLVDAVLLVVRSSSTTRDQLRAASEALERFPPRPAGTVLTGVEPSGEEGYGSYHYTAGRGG